MGGSHADHNTFDTFFFKIRCKRIIQWTKCFQYILLLVNGYLYFFLTDSPALIFQLSSGQCKTQTADSCRLQTADCRLQTRGKMQTEGQINIKNLKHEGQIWMN